MVKHYMLIPISNNGKNYITPACDTVYGGGGIMPDRFVPIDTATYPAGINRLFANGSFNSFVYTYYLKNKPQVDQYTSPTIMYNGSTN
jgi:carboxyl-terminal processing protease